MSRIGEDEEGVPWELWETIVSNALGGRKGQQALADLETALLALPEPKLIHGHLAAEGSVCAVGALVAHKRAAQAGVDLPAIIDAMGAGVQCECRHGRESHADGSGRCGGTRWGAEPCTCQAYELDSYEDPWETVQAGKSAGLVNSLAWHLAYLNDEEFGGLNPEERFQQMLAWVRRAQGKEAVAA